MLILAIPDATDTSISNLQAEAEGKWGGATTQKGSLYDELNVDVNYELRFDPRAWTHHYLIRIDSPGYYAVYLQHLPYEFENGFHFLMDERGMEVEPAVAKMAEDGHGHSHGGAGEVDSEGAQCPWALGWEWSASFRVEAGACYDWNAEKVDGEYADGHMKIIVMEADDPGLHGLEGTAKQIWSAITYQNELSAGSTIPLDEGRVLHFDQHTWVSHFGFCIPAGSAHRYVAIFAEHLPIEFESRYHFLRDASGKDVEPVVEVSAADCDPEVEEHTDLWPEVIGASIVTILPTLLSLFFIVKAVLPRIAEAAEGNGILVSVINSFASGVIFAAAVFLLLPEALHLVGVGKTEAGAAGMWGTAVLSAWFLCVITKHAGQLFVEGAGGEGAQKDAEKQSEVGRRIDWAVAVPILFGDAFHNFADGLVIGVAFKGCGAAFGWKLALITVLHEAPQEICDFAILVTRAGMQWPVATGLNFLSGLVTLVGAIITYSTDVSYPVEGFILAAGAGVYLFVATTELGSCVTELGKSGAPGAASRLLAFAIGAMLIGLILLDHEHCVPGSDSRSDGGGEEPAFDDPHAGHNHR